MTIEDGNRPSFIKDAPAENFASGILEVDLPAEFGPRTQGKVADMWIVNGKLMVLRTDRKSAYDHSIRTVPGTGAVLNLTSAFWSGLTSHIIPNSLVEVISPNVSIVKKINRRPPVEIVWREYLERSSTSTSLFYNYFDLGRRLIYGIRFPDGLKPNQRLPMGPVLTPTTKAESGHHDLELTQEEAREIADEEGVGTWDKIYNKTEAVYKHAVAVCRQKGIILASTKLELGIDDDTEDLIIIDEIITPDSSRLWRADTYGIRVEGGEDPDSMDKELIRKPLAQLGYRGGESVPVLPRTVIEITEKAYQEYHYLVTGEGMPVEEITPEVIVQDIKDYFARN